MWTVKTDQTGWMPWLIWVFAERTCHFAGFVMRRLRLNNAYSFLQGYCCCVIRKEKCRPIVFILQSRIQKEAKPLISGENLQSHSNPVYRALTIKENVCIFPWRSQKFVLLRVHEMCYDMTKPTKWVCAQQTQISLGIHPVLRCALNG